MASKVPAEVHDLVPEELRPKYGIYWSTKGERYYVFRDVAHMYDPEKKRSKVKRVALGSIKNGVFTYSPSYLKTLKIEELQSDNAALRKEAAATTPPTPELVRDVQKAVESLPDPRKHQNKIEYPLQVVLTVALLAAFAGYTSAVSIAIYWRQYHAELMELIEHFPEKEISHDTVNRLLRLIKPSEFHGLLTRMTQGLISQAVGRVFHIDGQAVSASKTEDLSTGRYMFNAYDSVNGVVAASLLIEEKQNEISTAMKLLSMIDLKPGDLVTADAMNTQKALVSYLVEREVGYCLAVKNNHQKLWREVHYLFAAADPSRLREWTALDAGHGRIEERTVQVLPANLLSKELLESWANLKDGCIIKVVNDTQAKSKRCRTSKETRYYMTTIPYGDDAAKVAGEIVRRHWSIENNLHWHLDVNFDQDRMQCTNGNFLSNRVTLHQIALGTLQAAQSAKTGARYSVRTLQQLCSTPSGAIETLGTILGPNEFVEKVKS